MYVADLIFIIDRIFHAMGIEPWVPNLTVPTKFLLRAKREIPFDELNTSFEGHSGRRREQKMNVVGHHHKRM